MLNTAFEIAEELELRKIEYKLHAATWIKYDLSALDLKFSDWNTIKYLNDDGSDFHPDVETLPNNTGGLYMFSINCPVIPGMTEYPVYIGRAQITAGQNLRKRCKEYLQKFLRNDERPKITRMFRYWSKDLYLSYISMADNDVIVGFEMKLINSLLLPFNDEIPDVELRQAIKAF